MKKHTFYSRIDIWLAASILGSLAWCAHLGWSLRVEEPVGAGIAVFIGISLAFMIVFGIFPCKYTLEQDSLNIQFGRTKQSILYKDILTWAPETGLSSGPIMSLRTVHIKYRGGSVHISPRDREIFTSELHKHVELAKKLSGISREV